MVKDIAIKNIEDLHNNTFEVLETEYKGLNQRVKYKCLICGYVGEKNLSHLKYEGKCVNCEKMKRLEENNKKQYQFHNDRAKKICAERGYRLIDVIKRDKTWYVRFDMDNVDRKGKTYGVIEQSEQLFLKNKYPKIMASDKVATPQETFILKAQKIHPELDFNNTIYINNKTSIKVICPKHGEFSVSPKELIKPEYKCFKCKKEEQLKKKAENTVNKMIQLHGGKYRYDIETFNGINNKMRMYCTEHGEFWQSPKYHLKGSGCPKCGHIKRGLNRRSTEEEFIKRVKEVHGDKYDLSMCKYVRSDLEVAVICHEKDKYGREHGLFYVTPHSFLSGQNCPKCVGKHQMSLEEFKETANIVHNNKYDYSLIKEYKGIYTKVPILCHQKDEFGREHGEFWQTPKHHLNGFGCKKCSSNYMDIDLFVERSNKVHRNKYKYTNIIEYTNNHSKVPIECPEHGIFLQSPTCHLNGQGCPYCKESHLERTVNNALIDNDIALDREYRFKWLTNDKTGYMLSLDFYLPDYNVAIECQGEQHFISNFYKSKGIEYAEEHLKGVQYRDMHKKTLCSENGVKLIYFTEKKFVEYMNEGDVYFTDVNELIKYIKTVVILEKV